MNKMLKRSIPIILSSTIGVLSVASATEKFKDYDFDSVVEDYNGEKYYPTKKEIKQIIAKAQKSNEYDHSDLENIDVFEKIKNNSNHYAYMYHTNDYTTAFYDANSPKEMQEYQKACEEVLKDFINKLNTKATNNVNADLCNLQDLKIILTNENDLVANYDEENHLILIDINKLKDFSTAREESIKDTVEYFLVLYLNKVRLDNCYHNEILIDGSRAFQGVKNIATGDIGKFVLTAAAETETLKFNDKDKSLYYEDKVKDSILLKLLSLFNNQPLENYNNAVFDADLNQFYRFMNCQNQKDVYELYKIMYAIDAKNMQNDFYTYYSLTDKVISAEDLNTKVGYNYLLDIYTKTLKNMANYTQTTPNFTLTDNLVMFNIIESTIYDNSTNLSKEDLEEFESKMQVVNEEYQEFLNDFYSNVNYDEAQNNAKSTFEAIQTNDLTNYKANYLIQKFPLIKEIRQYNNLVSSEKIDYYKTLKK